MFAAIQPTSQEVSMPLPGDEVLSHADVVMNRAFNLPAAPEVVWPWVLQMGKHRAGWYFPRSVERFVPRKRRGLREINLALTQLKVGDRIDDWGGKDGYLEVAGIDQPWALIYRSTRGKTSMSWALTLWPKTLSGRPGTRMIIRLRLTSSGKRWLFTVGDIFDKLTIAGMASGLRERL